MTTINKILQILFFAFIIWLFTKIFIFQTFQIYTPSMHNSMHEGDFILVNKLAYGPRFPITPLSLSWGNQHLFLDWIKLPYLRIPGYSSVKKNDIIVFNLPIPNNLPTDELTEYVKRCVGLPGDSILIDNGQVFINGEKLVETENILFNYTITSNANNIDSIVLNKLRNYAPNSRFTGNKHHVFISENNADSLLNLKDINFVEKNITPKEAYSSKYFPNNAAVKWNIDHFGPLYIPKQGDSIVLDNKNLIFYKKIIEQHENNTVENKNDSVFINRKYAKTYTFKMNYFFVLGDNRYNSIDSRYWGFVPENHLIGKASFILYSSNNK